MTATALRTAEEQRPPASADRSRGLRADVQGLRAVAVLLVLGYHAGVPVLGGGFVGVDVFFVLSGFLITGLIVREVEQTGTLRLGAFWARRARRLLPASAVVLLVSALVTVLVLPPTRFATTAGDLLASAFYAVNWVLAERSVDYLAADTASSPVQHFWSLAVEEQFYLVWPLLLLGLLAVRRRTGWRLRPVLLAGIALLALPSLAWSVHLTATDPGRAYFVSTTRVWELALGAVAALLAPYAVRLPRAVAWLMAWGGLVAVAVAAVTYAETTPFPGSAALLPTLGTAALVYAGVARTRLTGGLLEARPMQVVGGLSYSLYLWHWPLLVGARALWGQDGELALWQGVAVVAASAVPAWATFRWVEDPVHRSPRLAASLRRSAGVAVACTAVALAAALTVQVAVPAAATAPVETVALGAAVLGDDPDSDPDGAVVDRAPGLTPGPVEALEDVAALAGQRCIAPQGVAPTAPCTYGPADAEVVVAVVGDSKMHQWLPGLEAVADERGWRLETYLLSACPLVRVPIASRRVLYPDCAPFNEQRYRTLLARTDVDVVLTSQQAREAFLPDRPAAARRQAMVEDLRGTWRELEESGKQVVVLLDNPAPFIDVPECVAENLERLSACAFPLERSAQASGAPVQREALEQAPDVGVVDLTPWICPAQTCPAVVGDVLVYRRGAHLTATYAGTLAAPLGRALDAALAR